MIYRKDNTQVDLRSSQEGTLVPPLRDVRSVDMSQTQWILVIEKEAREDSLGCVVAF